MTFVRPSASTNISTPYTYKSLMPSTAQNYIDANFPNCLDKTGDTITGIIDITGSVVVEPSGSITIGTNTGTAYLTTTANSVVSFGGIVGIQSGSALDVLTGGSINVTGALIIDPGGTITVGSNIGSASMTVTGHGSITVNSGGLLTIGNSTGLAFEIINSNGALIVDSGGSLQCNSGSGISFYASNVSIQDSSFAISGMPTLPLAHAQTRVVYQPMIPQPNGTTVLSGFTVEAGSFFDGGSTGSAAGSYIIPLTKLINGATLSSLVINYKNTSGGTNNAANGYVYLVDGSGSGTGLGTPQYTASINNGQTLNISFTCSRVINNAVTNIYLVIVSSSGTGASTLQWFDPAATFSNITGVGQF